MLSNVADLEHAAMRTSLQQDRGMLLLLDFKAAFPSVEHEYLKNCLKAFGMPDMALNVMDTLYDQGRCVVQSPSGAKQRFDVSAGIRQGCPLSPLLFAAVMDALLRMLKHRRG